MRLSEPQIAELADAYTRALTGGDVVATLRLHLGKASVFTNHISFRDIDRLVVFNAFAAANAQDKLPALLLTAQQDGIVLNLPLTEPSPHIDGSALYPKLDIRNYADYVPTALVTDGPGFSLLAGSVANHSAINQRVLIVVRLAGASDTVKLTVDVPPGGRLLPPIRVPRFTKEEAAALVYAAAPAALTVELLLPAFSTPIDTFQTTVWLSQPDVALLARESAPGVIEDHTPALAWWVNSGSQVVLRVLPEILPLEVRREVGYPNVPYGMESQDTERVDRQPRYLYEGLRELKFTFMPTEPIWAGASSAVLQRVRRPDEILTDPMHVVNCLDAAVLFASLLEAMGLDPLLLVVQQHALVGWKRYQTSIDAPVSNKFLEVCGIVDATCLAADKDFDFAVSAAQGFLAGAKHLFGRKPSSLRELASIVDVKTARGRPSFDSGA